MSAAEAWRDAAEEHRETLEALAGSELDLQLVRDVRVLLDELDVSGRGQADG